MIGKAPKSLQRTYGDGAYDKRPCYLAHRNRSSIAYHSASQKNAAYHSSSSHEK
jgi:hypothetical protein